MTESIEATTRVALAKQERIRILIPSTEREKDSVKVGINGIVYNIPRDKEVEVPESVVEALEDAKVITYTLKKREGDDEGNELISIVTQRIAYQIKGRKKASGAEK